MYPPTPTQGPLQALSGYIFVPEPNSAYSLMLDSNVVTGNGIIFDNWFLGSTIEVSDNRVKSLNLVSGGNSCINQSGSLIFSGGGGIGAAGFYTCINGVISSVQLTSLGSFYSSPPTVTVSDVSCVGVVVTAQLALSNTMGPPRQAVGLVSLSTGQFISVSVPFSGLGKVVSYRLLSYQGVLTSIATVGPAGISNTPLPTIDGVLNTGSSPNLLLLDAAAAQTQGMYNGRVITFSTSINNISMLGAVSGITLNSTLLALAGCNPGSSGEISFIGGGGFGARGVYSIDSSGAFGTVSMISVGSGYSSPPSVLFPGSGCSLSPGTATVSLSYGRGCLSQGGYLIFTGSSSTPAVGTYSTMNGSIVGVFLQSGGSGYITEPQITVSDSSCVGYNIRAFLSDPLIAGSSRRIKSYSSNRFAQLSEPLLAAPTNTTRYRIRQPPYVTGWISMPFTNSDVDILADASSLNALPSLDTWFLSSTLSLTSSITSLVVQSSGNGCNSSTGTLAFLGGGGWGASASYSVINGSISQVTLLSEGAYYYSIPKVQLSDPACQNVAITVVLSEGNFSGTTQHVHSYTSTTRGTTARFFENLAFTPTTDANYKINPSPSISGSISLDTSATSSQITLDFVPWTSDIIAPYLGITVGAGSPFVPYAGKNITLTSSVAKVSLSLSVVGLTVVSPGNECASAYGTLILVGGGGSGAAGQYSIQNGRLFNLTLISGGSGYSSAPQVILSTVYGCYVQPSITAIMSTGGNSNPSCVSGQLAFSGGGGIGAAGNFISVGGVVVSVTLSSGGAGYTSLPSVTATGCQVSFSVTLSDPIIPGFTVQIGSFQSASRLLNLKSAAPDTPLTWTGYRIESGQGPIGMILNVPVNDISSFSVDSSAAFCAACKDRRGSYFGSLFTSKRDWVGWDITLSTSISSVEFSKSVTSLTLLDGGSGYPPSTSGNLTFVSSDNGVGATGTYTVNSAGSVSQIVLLTGGSGYFSPPAISIAVPTCANFTQAKIQSSISQGGIGCILSTGVLNFSGGSGINAAGTYSVSAGVINNVTITNGGMFFESVPIVTVSDPSCKFYSLIAVLKDQALAGQRRKISSFATGRTYTNIAVSVPYPSVPTETTSYRISQPVLLNVLSVSNPCFKPFASWDGTRLILTTNTSVAAGSSCFFSFGLRNKAVQSSGYTVTLSARVCNGA